MDVMLQPSFWLGLATLTFLEIVLGIDNIIFISIITNRLKKSKQANARFLALSLALIIRVSLLFCLTWLAALNQPFFEVSALAISARDLVLGAGGIFLIYKSTNEIYRNIEADISESPSKEKTLTFKSAVLQIVLIDIVFSFDSLLTAIGLTSQLAMMIVAIIIAMVIMLTFSNLIAKYIKAHPSLEILCLSFLIMIGFSLFMESTHNSVPKGYLYCAICFSLMMEIINIQIKKKKHQKFGKAIGV